MKGSVTGFCSPEDIRIPEEMLAVEVSAAEVEDALRRLSLRYAAQTQVQSAQWGDIITCRVDASAYPDGRAILLYTGLEIPEAEDAVSSVVGRRVGETFTAELAGQMVQLTVEKCVRLAPAEVTDDLVAAQGLEGVRTVADYRRYTAGQLRDAQITEKSKMTVGWLVDQMMEGSTFAYDAEELDAYLSAHMADYQAECEADGVEISEEEIRREMVGQFKQGWLAEAYCEHCGIRIDMEAVTEQAKQMAEMMSLMGEETPDWETLLAETLRSAYCIELFTDLEKRVKAKMGD